MSDESSIPLMDLLPADAVTLYTLRLRTGQYYLILLERNGKIYQMIGKYVCEDIAHRLWFDDVTSTLDLTWARIVLDETFIHRKNIISADIVMTDVEWRSRTAMINLIVIGAS